MSTRTLSDSVSAITLEQLEVARKIKRQFEKDADIEAVLWDESEDSCLGQSVLASLMSAKERYDFAILVLNPDDSVESRGILQKGTRDNVLFELGLFIGAIGHDRTFAIYNLGENLKMPTEIRTYAADDQGRPPGNLPSRDAYPTHTAVLPWDLF